MVEMLAPGIIFILVAAANAASSSHRIVGGSVTTINQYPYSGAVLKSRNVNTYVQDCGSSILNSRSLLSAAHCFFGQSGSWRVRVGSTYASSGGTVVQVQQIINHPSYNEWTQDSDIAVIRVSSSLTFSNTVQPASIAGTNYNVGDNQPVWAIGWGLTEVNGFQSEQLRHVQIWTVNQAVCNAAYVGSITDNMLCSGWLNVGGRDQCTGDSGGPLIHNGVVVGVCSFGFGCGHPDYPGVNARVSRFTSWIESNA